MNERAHVFPDTNIFLHFPAIDGLDWPSLCRAKEVTIHISQPLLAELNKIKETGRNASVRNRAKTIIRRLKNILSRTGSCPPGVIVHFEDASPNVADFPGLNPQIGDDQLLAAVLTYKASHSNERILIATDDDGLGLQIKCGTRQIELIEPPDELRIPSEPDPNEAELRRLKLENETLRNLHPKVRVEFRGGHQLLKFTLPTIDVESTVEEKVEEKVEEARKALPRLTVPQRHKGSSLSLSMEEFIFTPENVAKYNQQLDQFFISYGSAIRAKLQARARTFLFTIVCENIGRAPAEDMRVHLHFPDGFQLRKNSEWIDFLKNLPRPPSKPKSPLAHINEMGAFLTPAYRASTGVNSPPATTFSIRRTNSYDVNFTVKKFQHGESRTVGEFALTFDQEAFSFATTFRVSADNLPDAAEGKLNFVFEPT